MALSYKEVAEILQIIDASDCEEVILELEGIKLTVRRGAAGGVGATAPVAAPAPSPATPTAATPSAGAPVAGSSSHGADNAAGGLTIRAPMVGTFYRAPAPDKPAFVEIGSTVAPGDPVCLIEVMKLYTTIESTHAGTIRSIAASDGELVEFDQPLFVIDPA